MLCSGLYPGFDGGAKLVGDLFFPSNAWMVMGFSDGMQKVLVGWFLAAVSFRFQILVPVAVFFVLVLILHCLFFCGDAVYLFCICVGFGHLWMCLMAVYFFSKNGVLGLLTFWTVSWAN